MPERDTLPQANKIKVLMTTVPAEAGGGIASLHQLIAKHNVCLDLVFCHAASRSPFAEPVLKRVARSVVQSFKIGGLLRGTPAIRIVHVNTAPDSRAILRDALIVVAARLFGRKIIVQIHGGIGDYQRPFVVNAVARGILPLCHSIVVLTMKDKSIIDSLGLNKKAQVIPNAVVVRDFQPSGRQGTAGKKEMVVLFLSRLIREKGVYELIASIETVIRSFPAVRFVFAGDGPEKEAMEETCRARGVERWVTFTGHLGYDDVVNSYSSADVFVLPSYSEAMPMTILQALAAGVPIVATRCGAVPEILEEDCNVMFVDMKDAAQLAEKILALLRDAQMRERMGKANLELALTSYDITILLRRLRELYLSLSEGS